MASHPSGLTVEIVGTESGANGRSCDEHEICGTVIEENSVVRFRKVQVIIKGKEESAIAAYLVEDGVDQCRVGFLRHHLVKHWHHYDGVLAQVIDVYTNESKSATCRRKFYHNKGCCVAAIISCMNDDTTKAISNQKRMALTTGDNEFPEEKVNESTEQNNGK